LKLDRKESVIARTNSLHQLSPHIVTIDHIPKEEEEEEKKMLNM
jgi:hypothetical protein